MAKLQNYWKYDSDHATYGEKQMVKGFSYLNNSPIFRNLRGTILIRQKEQLTKTGAACVNSNGEIFVNPRADLSPEQWAYTFAHCLLHLAFGHFDSKNIPNVPEREFCMKLWNLACDIYIARFLADIKFGNAICKDPAEESSFRLNDERKIYEHLVSMQEIKDYQKYGTNHGGDMDMIGLEHPITYPVGSENPFAEQFVETIRGATRSAIGFVRSRQEIRLYDTEESRAFEWFLTNYPLLGSMAASFQLIRNQKICYQYEIHIAAVDAEEGKIYTNPSTHLTEEEWKFILAHEFLHAGLMHHKRCQGRNMFLWNVACDYVINDWLHELKIGKMPEGCLYDPEFHGYSCEGVYDFIVQEMRKYSKALTFRGFKKGDILFDDGPRFRSAHEGFTIDEFMKQALAEGLEYHQLHGRGYLPAGLVEEILALNSPPIPWDVELGKWFDWMFPPLEKTRSYARPSRRQGSTPDIPRPRDVLRENDIKNRTFGVIIDTSGSVSKRQLALALGAVASYAVSKDVSHVRIVFCDANAYDKGYLPTEQIADKVEVTGRGGTVLQPAATLLKEAADFPKDAPVLIITDGMIENRLHVAHEHAYLLPKGRKLPFKPKGKVFHFSK